MRVPFGFGVGDFVAVGTLAWDVYKSCKGAPESFGKISIEVLSLHAVLKEAEEAVLAHPLPFDSHARLETVYKGCQSVLEDLQELLKKYESLGTQSKRTWDRVRWGGKGIAELRARITSSISMLGVFLSTSQVRVEQRLKILVEEYQQGKHEASLLPNETIDSLSANDKFTWREIRKKLDEIGISVTAFDTNRDFILEWLVQAADSGAFNERAPVTDEDIRVQLDLISTSASSSRLDPRCAPAYGGSPIVDQETERVAQENATFESELDALQIGIKSLPSLPDITDPKDLPSPLSIVRRSPEQTIAISTIFAEIQSRTRKQLLHSVNKGDGVEALNILRKTARCSYLNPETFSFALQGAIERRLPKVVAALIANGANINHSWSYYSVTLRLTISNWTPLCKARHRHDIFDILLDSGANASASLNHNSQNHFTLLHLAAARHDCFAVRKIVEHGADDNGHSAYGSPLMLALARPEARCCAELLIELGADVNYSRGPDGTSNPVLCPLDVAIVGASISLIDFLLGKGATVLPRNIRMAHALAEGDIYSIPSVFFPTQKTTPKNDFTTWLLYVENPFKAIISTREERSAQDSAVVQKSVLQDTARLK